MEKYPTSTPEHESQPERSPFNIETMTNADFIEIGRDLAAAADKLGEAHEGIRLDDLWHRLQKAARQLPAHDIDRARVLLSEQLTSGNSYDLEAAAEWVEGFLEYDYELTRDTLVRIYADDSLPGYDGASELAGARLVDLEDRLTPEQRTDFAARIARYHER